MIPHDAASSCGIIVRDKPLDLQHDDHNCGMCGHDCTVCGGTCEAGACTPTVLASRSDFTHTWYLAIDDTNVYWTDEGGAAYTGSVLSVPKSGGAITTLASGQTGPLGIAVTGTDVYWSDHAYAQFGAGVMKAPLGGGDPVVIAGPPDGVSAFALLV